MTEDTMTIREGLVEWSAISARGAQSEAFLQGQLSQDLSAISDGAWALVLTPDSVVITSCFVTKCDDGFDMQLPRALGDVALTRLRRFLLRTKCTLTIADTATGPFTTVEQQVRAGLPGVGEFERHLTPHSFGGSFIASTVSFSKGCFTGQELVGRLDARGSSVPWRFVRVIGPNVARIEELLRSKGPTGPQGVTSVSRSSDAVAVLGIAHRTLLDPELLAEWSDLAVEPIV
jgi:folate-binding Fe-S cluster repair protein YgfZ